MISKQTFIEGIDLIVWGLRSEEKFCDCLEKLSDDAGYCDAFIYNRHNNMIEKLMVCGMGEDSPDESVVEKIADTIEWWIYDTECGKSHACIYNPDTEEVEVEIKDAGILYDYLVKEYNLPVFLNKTSKKKK